MIELKIYICHKHSLTTDSVFQSHKEARVADECLFCLSFVNTLQLLGVCIYTASTWNIQNTTFTLEELDAEIQVPIMHLSHVAWNSEKDRNGLRSRKASAAQCDCIRSANAAFSWKTRARHISTGFVRKHRVASLEPLNIFPHLQLLL